jgi:hypothetical protein
MRSSLMNAFAGVFCLALAACAASGNRNVADEAAKAELDDLIVPGSRVGPVSLGMSEAALRQLMGQPLETYETEDNRMFEFKQLSVVVPKNTRRVELVIVPASHYATLLGATVGDSEARIQELYGEPARKTSRGQQVTRCYSNGIVFNIENDVVDNIVVRTPGC